MLDRRFVSDVDFSQHESKSDIHGNEEILVSDTDGIHRRMLADTFLDEAVNRAQAPAPEIVTYYTESEVPTSVNENTTTRLKIKDYDPYSDYIITANKGIIGKLESDGSFNYTAPDITDGQNTTDSIFIHYKLDTVISKSNQYDITINYISMEVDTLLSDTDFLGNEAKSYGVSVSTGSIDFNSHTRELGYAEEFTTTKKLVTFVDIKEGMPVTLGDALEKEFHGTLKNVTKRDISNTLDVFGDNTGLMLYKFENNANDESGVYNGTWYGNEQYADGYFGKCAKFDGNSYIKHDFGSVTVENFTRMCGGAWVKMESFPDPSVTASTIFSLNSESSPYPIFALFNDGNNFIGGVSHDRVYHGHHYTFNTIGFPNSKFELNKWNHIFFSYGGHGLYIYLNGKKLGYISYHLSMMHDYESFTIGAGNSNGDYKFEGLIDNVRIFKTGFDEDRSRLIYNYMEADISDFGIQTDPHAVYFDKGMFYEKIVSQDSGDTDWEKIENTELYYTTDEIDVNPNTTNESFYTSDDIYNGQKVVLVRQDNSVVRGTFYGVKKIDNICDYFLDNSCKILYRFEHNTFDDCGNFNGSIHGAAIYRQYSKFGEASFNVSRGNFISFTRPVDRLPFTISFFIKTSINSSNSTQWKQPTIVGFRTGSNKNDFAIQIKSGNLYIFTGFGGTDRYLNTYKLISDNAWHHVVVAFDTSEYIVYVDGTQYGSMSYNNTTTIDTSRSYWTIGTLCTNDNYYHPSACNISGYIDQFRIFDRVLSQDEVHKISRELNFSYITAFELDSPPKNALSDVNVNVKIDMKKTLASVNPDKVKFLKKLSEIYDGHQFKITFDKVVKEFRYLQRYIEVEGDNVSILTPFNSNLYKKT